MTIIFLLFKTFTYFEKGSLIQQGRVLLLLVMTNDQFESLIRFLLPSVARLLMWGNLSDTWNSLSFAFAASHQQSFSGLSPSLSLSVRSTIPPVLCVSVVIRMYLRNRCLAMNNCLGCCSLMTDVSSRSTIQPSCQNMLMSHHSYAERTHNIKAPNICSSIITYGKVHIFENHTMKIEYLGKI
jgi:hypothetical protein